jgi:hypothetical protein
MPPPGGASDKIGNRFELRWTVRQFIRLLTGEAEWIHLEPIGDAGDKVEFLLAKSDGRIEAHQVKRQQSGRGHWTIADLDRVGVLDGLRKHAVDGDAIFVFMSTMAAKSLSDLVHRANGINGDLAAFQAALSIDLSGEFNELEQRLGKVGSAQTLKALCNSDWKNQDEQGLADTVLALLGAYLTGDPETACDGLARFAMDSVHRRITQGDLWKELDRRGIQPSELSRDKSLSVRLSECATAFLESRPYGICDLTVPRIEAVQITETLLDSAAASTVFLEGPAGVGKSGVVAQVVQQMAEAGWPTLPVRLDLLDPTQQPAEIGYQLLRRDKSPVALLAGLAAGRDCLLILDQLDAVSVVSGRNPEVFNAVTAMVRETRAHPKLRVLLVCRSFDLENDPRLRELSRQDGPGIRRIPVGSFDAAAVNEVLVRLGIDPARFDARQLDLLRLPLHLALLAGIVTGEPGKSLTFATAKDLYDAYWLRKRTDLRPVLADPNVFETLLQKLCDAMNDRQTLSVPRGLLPSGDADLDRLVSANVLVRQGLRIGFFHEGFFDYVFARRFSELGGPLLHLLRSVAEQDLFRRSQVRQILIYRRDEDFESYISDLRDCLGADDVRFHIKKLMIGLIGLTDDPRPEEWSILVDHLGDRETCLTGAVREALWPSAAWVRFIRNLGVLSQWLNDPRGDVVNFAFSWLGSMVKAEPDLVADLLEGETGHSPEQDERVLAIAGRHEAAVHSSRIEALFHRLAAGPDRDWGSICSAYRAFIQTHAYGDKRAASVACRALGRWLGLAAGHPDWVDDFSQDRQGASAMPEGVLLELATGAPDTFVEALVRPLLRILDTAADQDSGSPFSDRIWFGGFHGWSYRGPEVLLLALVKALKETASFAPELYRTSLARLRASDFQTAHGVLLRALSVEGMDAKSIAIDYLIETWTRWGIWFDSQALWDCRLLLQTLEPDLDSDDIARLEPWILDHWERWDSWNQVDGYDGSANRARQAQWHRSKLGIRQLTLLSALPDVKLSPTGRRRLGELERKARAMGWTLEAPHGVRGGVVISPVPKQATARMNDAQWLSAIRRYRDDSDKQWLDDRVLGGARQLAGALEERTKTEPERFAKLLLALPDDANEAYSEAIVRGLHAGALPLELLAHVAERVHDRLGRPHGRWLPRIIASHGGNRLQTDLLDIIAWYATEDPDPAEEHWRSEEAGKDPAYGGDPRFHGINSVRGSTAHAIATLIAQDVAYWEYFAPILEPMVGDPSIAVRSCVADACIQVLRYDRSNAIRLFLRLCETDDVLLTARSIEDFIYYTADTEFESILPILERMLESPRAAARQAASRQATLAALSLEEARPLADAALNGDAEMRQGVAEVLAFNVLSAPDRSYARSRLIGLFADPDAEVQRSAGDWTEQLTEATDGEPLAELLTAYIESPAFAPTASSFFGRLDRAAGVSPSVLFRAGQRFVDSVGTDAGNIAGVNAHAAMTLSELVLRAYRQAENAPDLRRQCLDLFDRLLEAGGYGADKAVEAFSR